MKKNLLIGIIITFLLCLGFLLRYHNISSFKIYPDTYQNLLVAENIKNHMSVLGSLGIYGTPYPDYFSWTRSGYALLILIVNNITYDTTIAAQSISFTFGMIAIIVAYFLLAKFFSSYLYGLAAALFIAISFNHTVWSGFIMTETIGVLALLLFLLSLVSSEKKLPTRVNLRDVVTGVLLGYAILTRYEYLVICIPLFFLILFTSAKPVIRLLTIFISSSILIALFFLALFPVQSTVAVIQEQLPDQLTRLSFMIGIVAIGLFFPKKLLLRVKPFITKWGPYSVLVLPLLFVMSNKLILFKKFFILDFFLSIFSIIGLFLLLRDKRYRSYGYFVFISCLFLGIIYQNINSAMDRYITHLIPFLIIPASYGLVQTIQYYKKKLGIVSSIVFVLIAIAIPLQILLSYYGLRYMQDHSWFRISYEEKTAQITNKYISKDILLIAALPEPYFYTTNVSSYSLADTYPFIFIPDDYNKKHILIVEDMALRKVFPKFTNFLHKYLHDNVEQSFFIHERFHLKNTVIEEKYPVILYDISLDELKKKIEIAHRHRNTP